MDTRVLAQPADQLSSTLDATANDNIVLRAAEPADAAEMSALMGSPGVFEGTLQMPDAAVASRLERLGKTDATGVQLVAVDLDTPSGAPRIAAHAGLFTPHASLRRMHARGLGITVGKDFQGQGLGDRLMHRLLDWADNWAGVLRVELTVFTDNTRAIALYQRHGFVQEGVLRAYGLRGGEYIDAFSMARLHPKQPKLPPR
jgi:L-phenylalanine/L-methionine N-acetyltransferase